jgi:squalene-hopene/tetraprenyl-beta-curcumene cyclase
MPVSTVQAPSDAQVALGRACERLLSLQDGAGWWQGELQTNVTMDAEDMLLREFLGIRRPEETERSAVWIRSQQREDGTWTNFHGGPGELSTTIEAYWALRLAGDPAEAEHMRAAAGFIRARGGIERARVFTHVWLALFGLWSWDRVPALPPEIVLLPVRAPLNIYDFACWARQTIVALSLIKAHRPVRTLAFDLAELHACGPPAPGRPTPERSVAGGAFPGRPATPHSRWLTVFDALLRAYERRPIGFLRRLALGRAERWIVRRQEADGSWGGIQPPWVYSLMALHMCGYPLEHPVLRRGLEGLDRFMVEDRGDGDGRVFAAPAGPSRRLEACQSPVWDTALAMIALADAGIPAEHPALRSAAGWLLGEEVAATGDWAVARPGLAPGGWAFEFANVTYPDIDDTAEVVLALRRLGGAAGADGNGMASGGGIGTGDGTGSASAVGTGNGNGRMSAVGSEPAAASAVGTGNGRVSAIGIQSLIDAAIGRAARWVQGMQSSDGGWAAFDADNVRRLVRELPFLDFGEVIDEPSADVTAHALEMLAALDLLDTPAARRGVRWLLAHQEPDGSWFGRWGINHIYGTGAAVPALIAAGVAPAQECIRRAIGWLAEHQNEDGGWGEDPRSYDDPAWIGRGPSTASQTAWALLALHAAGDLDSPACKRGVDWLVGTQRADGTWDEPQYTGTGFPSDYYINYHLYRLVFPIAALGRCLRPAAEG